MFIHSPEFGEHLYDCYLELFYWIDCLSHLCLGLFRDMFLHIKTIFCHPILPSSLCLSLLDRSITFLILEVALCNRHPGWPMTSSTLVTRTICSESVSYVDWMCCLLWAGPTTMFVMVDEAGPQPWLTVKSVLYVSCRPARVQWASHAVGCTSWGKQDLLLTYCWVVLGPNMTVCMVRGDLGWCLC